MHRVLMVVCVLLAAAAAATAVFFQRENRALRAELAARPTKPPAAETPHTALVKSETSAEPTPAAGPGTVMPLPPPATATSASPPSPPGGRDSDRRERGQEFFARALADPESRDAMLTRAKGQIDRIFGDYFVKLGINETQIEALRTLLAERQMARMASGMLERAAETDQERADAQAWREAKLATTETDINAILGADGLKNLQSYVDSAPQREVVDDIARRASYAGAPLSSEASNQLLKAVQQASAATPLPQLGGRGRWNSGDDEGATRDPVTAETVSNYMRDLRARNQQIIDQAKSFLTQSQLEALADQQIDEMQQTEARLNFMVRNPDARGFGRARGGGG